MTELQREKIDKLINVLPANEKQMYREIAELAVELGFSPQKIKCEYDPVRFSKKTKEGFGTLIKISPPNPEKGEKTTGFAMLFSNVKDYSVIPEVFREAIRATCESGKNRVGEYGCGRCGSHPCSGYKYIYPDGRQIMCCHDKPLVVPIKNEHLEEVKEMMKKQTGM